MHLNKSPEVGNCGFYLSSGGWGKSHTPGMGLSNVAAPISKSGWHVHHLGWCWAGLDVALVVSAPFPPSSRCSCRRCLGWRWAVYLKALLAALFPRTWSGCCTETREPVERGVLVKHWGTRPVSPLSGATSWGAPQADAQCMPPPDNETRHQSPAQWCPQTNQVGNRRFAN